MQKNQEEVGLLGPVATGFTIFKGFVASGILYLPTNFTTGGYGFSGIMLLGALAMTLFCIKLLLDTRVALGGKMSLPEIGFACYGWWGKLAVDVSLFASQYGFVCAYIYFIASQGTSVLESITGNTYPISFKWWYGPICFIILFPLVLVRKIQTFAKFHVFGDVMVGLLVVVSMTYAATSVVNNGWTGGDYNPMMPNPNLTFFNPKQWPNCIGFAVYSFEGIGVILPIQDITEDKENYFKIICITCFIITAIYFIYAEFCLFAWFGEMSPEKPLITEYLPFNWFTDLVKFLFACQLIISYTLVIYPANMIVEGYMFGSWPKSRKRQMAKNISRAFIIICTIVTALAIYNKLESFLSIVGSLSCTPIAFTLPAWFHYKACAKDQKAKLIDLAVIAMSLFILVFCTIFSVLAW